jgi:hypothetical protein
MGNLQLVGVSMQEIIQVAFVGCPSFAIAAEELPHDAVPSPLSPIIVHTKGGRLVLGHFRSVCNAIERATSA